LLAALLCELPPGPVELASLTKIPRVVVAPFGSISRIDELGGRTVVMLTFGILTYPGLTAVSFGDGFWPKLVAEAPSRNIMHREANTNDVRCIANFSLCPAGGGEVQAAGQ
jgi:hypothetical protein